VASFRSMLSGLSDLLNTKIHWFGDKIGPKWYTTPIWHNETQTSQRYSLLQLLSTIHSERLDAKRLLSAFAEEHRGAYRRKLRTFADRLGPDTSLIAALEKTPGVLSPQTILALRFGSHSGILTQTYDQLLQSDRPVDDYVQRELKGAIGYWFCLFAIMTVILFFMARQVAPKLRYVESEFNLLSNSTLVWIESLARKVDVSSIAMGLIVIGLLCYFAIPFLGRLLQPKRWPLLSRIETLKQSSSLLRLLSLSASTGRPMATSLSTLAKYHFDKQTRGRLLLARNEMEQGEKLWQSLADSRLLTIAEANALSIAPSASVQAWMLSRFATNQDERSDRLRDTLLTLLKPLITILFAIAVLSICFSYFQFLSNIIHSLSKA
jgi:type II secretory pathway component PulF